MNFSKREKYYFEKAKQLALMSNYPRIHIGSVIVYKNRIIGMGINSTKTKPIQYRYNQKYRQFDNGKICENGSIHAEFAAVLNAESLYENIDWSKCEIYNYRINSLGITGQSRPCPSCSQLLKEKGITNWYYTSQNGGLVFERIN